MEFKEKLLGAFGIPADVALNLARLTFIGDRAAYIENYTGIVEYTNDSVTLSTEGGLLKITGSELCVISIESESITLRGRIKSVEFIEK